MQGCTKVTESTEIDFFSYESFASKFAFIFPFSMAAHLLKSCGVFLR